MDRLTWSEFLMTLEKAFKVRGKVVNGVPIIERDNPPGPALYTILQVSPKDGNSPVPFAVQRAILRRLGISEDDFNRA